MTADAVPAVLTGRFLQTALYQAQIMEHPHWGFGIATRLRLPFTGEGQPDVANCLNLIERTLPECHHLGAWCCSDVDALVFASFLPAKVFGENPGYARPLFGGLVWHQASRASWANNVLALARREH